MKLNINWKVIGLWFLVSISLVFVIVVIPFGTQSLINIESNQMGSDDGWLGFWGGYLGSIIGVIGAFVILQWQLRKDKETRRVEKIDNTFFNLLSLHNEQHNKLFHANNNIFNKTYNDIIYESKKQLQEQNYQYIIQNFSLLNDILSKLISDYDTYIKINVDELSPHLSEQLTKHKNGLLFGFDRYENSYNEENKVYSNCKKIITLIDKIKEFSTKITNNSFPKLKHNYISEYNEYLRLIVASARELPVEYTQIEGYKEETDATFKNNRLLFLDDERKYCSVKNAINKNHKDLGSYFRIFHRIVKYINSNVTNTIQKQEYIGFLRANTNEQEILILFYNAVYTERGAGLLEELSKTTFFGKSNEFIDGKELPFVNRDSLIWGDKDFQIMKDLPAELERRKTLEHNKT